MAVYRIKKLSSTFAETLTFDEPSREPAGAYARICVSDTEGGDSVKIVEYGTVDTSGPTYIQTLPRITVYRWADNFAAFLFDGDVVGWLEASYPVSLNGKFYCHWQHCMYGQSASGTINTDPVAHTSAVVDLTSPVFEIGELGNSHYKLRPAAILDNYAAAWDNPGTISSGEGNERNSYAHAGNSPPYVPVRDGDNDKLFFCHGNLSSAVTDGGSVTYSLDELTYADPAGYSVAHDMVGVGGTVYYYDGYRPEECGFISAPSVFLDSVESPAAGALPAGLYNYVALYSYTGMDGRTHYSRVSRPATVSVTQTADVTLEVILPGVCSRRGDMQVHIYRTTVGGTQYQRIVQARMRWTDLGTNTLDRLVYRFTDPYSDSDIASFPFLFRQPGTQGTALDRYHALAGTQVLSHKDRKFYFNGSNVYYSSFAVDTEAPWFNPAFFINIPTGEGDVTGLGSMDGTLVVFKTGDVFLVDGDGPPENGGTGTEFSPPRRIHTEFGCVDHRSIVNTPNGIMYRSKRGIELLGRDYRVRYQGLGERIQRTVDSYTTTLGSTYDLVSGCVLFLLSNGTDSIVVVYDTVNDAWTLQDYSTGAATYSMNDVVYASSYTPSSGALGDRVYYCSDDGVLLESRTQGADTLPGGSARTPDWVIETGWVKARDLAQGMSMQERIRVSDLLVLGQRSSNFNLRGSAYYNYNTSSANLIKAFNASETNLTVPQLEFQPARESLQSIKFRLVTEQPTVSTTVGSGKQLDMLGLSVRVGVKGGGAKLPVAQKG